MRVTELARKDVTLTINYIRYDGAPIAKPHTEPLKTGDQYLVISPSKPGLVPDIKEVQGYASREDITITVTYSVSTDDKWTIDGSYIKYTENGSFLKNTSKTIDGKTYRFNASGQLELNDSFVTIKGNTYYLVNNRITTGYKVIGSAIYFFTDNGIMLVNSTRDGHRFDSDGTLSGEDGTINIGDKTYYLKGNSLYSGFIEQEGIIYYFGDDFSMVKGDTYGTFKFNGLGHLVDGITIDGLIFSSVPNVEYTGEEQKPSVTVKFGNITLTEGIHFNLVYSNNVDPGKATVEINGIGAVSGSKELNFTIIGEEAFTLTIRYVNPADQPVAPDYVSMYAPGDEYLVYCPHVPGYIAENAVTEGKMPKSDVTITVIYTPEIIEPVNPDTDSDSNCESEPADTKPTISSSIIEVEGTSKTNIERQDIVTKTYNWDLLVIVFLVATVICGGSILLIINWDYIKRYLVKRHRTKRS